MKLFKTFTIFLKIFSKKVSLDIDFGKLREIILDMAKIHQPLVKKETCDFWSSRIVLNYWKMIYVFKLEHKKVLPCEIYNTENFVKQVNLKTKITKNKLIEIFILKIQYLKYNENPKRESKNINDICWVDANELMKKMWFGQIGLWWILLSLVGLLWRTLLPQIDLLVGT